MRHNSTSEDRFRGADPFTQLKLVSVRLPRKDSRLGEPEHVERHWGSNLVPPDCESGELTTTVSRPMTIL